MPTAPKAVRVFCSTSSGHKGLCDARWRFGRRKGKTCSRLSSQLIKKVYARESARGHSPAPFQRTGSEGYWGTSPLLVISQPSVIQLMSSYRLGVGGASGLGFSFFLLELIPGAPPTRLMCGFFFLVFRDSELFVPGEKKKEASINLATEPCYLPN